MEDLILCFIDVTSTQVLQNSVVFMLLSVVFAFVSATVALRANKMF